MACSASGIARASATPQSPRNVCSPAKARAGAPDLFSTQASAWSPVRRRSPSPEPSSLSIATSPASPRSANPERAAGVAFFGTPKMADVLQQVPGSAEQEQGGMTLTWAGWSGRRSASVRNNSPSMRASLDGESPRANIGELLEQEFKDSGMHPRGRQSPRGTGAAMQRSSVPLEHVDGPCACHAAPLAFASKAGVGLAQITELQSKGCRSPRTYASTGVALAFAERLSESNPGALTLPRVGRRASSPPLPSRTDSKPPWTSGPCEPCKFTAGGVAALRNEAALLGLRGPAVGDARAMTRALSPRAGGSGYSSTEASVSDFPQQQVLEGLRKKVASGAAQLLAKERAKNGKRS